MKFFPCNGDCAMEDTHCASCGRSEEEVTAMNQSVEALIVLAEKMKYENPAEFADAVAVSMKYKMGLGH